MLSSINVKFIFDSAGLSASLGDKKLLSSANILQIANASVKLSSRCPCYVFSQQLAYFFLLKQVKFSAILCPLPKQLNLVSSRSSWLTVQSSGNLAVQYFLKSFFTYGKILPNLFENSWL